MKLTAVLVGRSSHGSEERTPHRTRAAESAGRCDLLEALVGSLQLLARRFCSHLQNMLSANVAKAKMSEKVLRYEFRFVGTECLVVETGLAVAKSSTLILYTM